MRGGEQAQYHQGRNKRSTRNQCQDGEVWSHFISDKISLLSLQRYNCRTSVVPWEEVGVNKDHRGGIRAS